MRTKIIKLTDDDGPGAKVGALTYDQVEKYMAAEIVLDKLGLPTASVDLLCDALTNAEPDKPWAPKRVHETWDIPAIKELVEKVMEYSGLKLQKIEKGEAPAGEMKPAAA